jgi:hypothetical protein
LDSHDRGQSESSERFCAGETTLNDQAAPQVERVGHDLEINGGFAYEQWKAPIYPAGVPVYLAIRHR